MTWVRLDDRFPSHRKIALLSDRAFRMHVSALCWSAENLTDGVIQDRELRLVAHVRNMTATARELVTNQLWVRIEGGWRIHDYLEYNPSRDQVLSERQKNAARQQAFRDRKKGSSTPPPTQTETPPEIKRNGVTPPVTNSVSNALPGPVPVVTPNGVTTRAACNAREDGPEIRSYDTLAELKRAVAETGLTGFSWKLRTSQIQRAAAVMERVGPEAMAALAAANSRYRGAPANASAWLADWESIEPAAPQQPPPDGEAADAPNVIHFRDRQQQSTDDLFGAAMARAEARMREENSS